VFFACAKRGLRWAEADMGKDEKFRAAFSFVVTRVQLGGGDF
jgi:hypothetical protein